MSNNDPATERATPQLSSRSASLDLRIVVSVVAGLGLQFFSASAMPLLLGSIADALALGAAQVGLLGTLELAAMAVTATGIAPIVARRSRVALSVVGCLVAGAGQLMAVPAETFALLALSRVVAGTGMGVSAAAAQGAVAAAAKPDRLFGIFFAASTPLGALLLLVLPYLIAAGGYGAGYTTLAVISLVAVPLVIWLPRAPLTDGEKNARLDRAPQRAVAIPALIAVALVGASDLGMWTFIERIGSGAGLTPEGVGQALAAATLAGSVCATIAAWLSTRFGRVIPIIVSFATMVGVAVALGGASRAETYVPLVIVWSASVFVGLTYAMGALAAADSSGRWSAAAAGARAVGGALGPAAAGLVVGSGGYQGAGLLVGSLCAVGLILSVPLAVHLSRHLAASR